MAKKAPQYEAHPLDGEAGDRLDTCREQKAPFEQDIREGYFFAAPLRMRQINSSSAPATTPLHDDGELQTSLGYELVQDFGTEMLNNFMPQAENWCERAAGMFVPDAAWDKVKEQVRKDDTKIFDGMKASNLYPELAKAFIPDLALGTVGIQIIQPKPHAAIVALAVPIRELEIDLGPFGEVDTRFIVRHTKGRYVRALLKEVADKIPADIAAKIKDKPNDHVEIRWGYWRMWDDDSDECWQHVVMIGRRVVHDAVLKGEGCCPLIVMRFGATSDWAWGVGPLITGLPELRQTDELEGQKISHIELNLTPPLGIPDESFAAMEQGLEAGMAYPTRHSGGNGKIERLYEPGPAESGIYAVDAKGKTLRKHFYVDYPEQTGDTPPTLGQWLDELARAQRRIGTPGLPFWNEGPAKIFLRFKFLLEKAGVIAPVTVDGKSVSMRPYNPAQRAAEQQEIAMAIRAIQIWQSWPEEFKVTVDGKASMEKILDKMRVTLLVNRDPEQVKAAVAQIAQLTAGHLQPGNAAGGPGAPQQLSGLP